MVKEILAKTILNKHKKRDAWFLDDYTVNPYSGCAHACSYCYVPGSKYGTKRTEGLAVKKNAEGLLEKQIAARARKGEHGFIALSSATDPYTPPEERLGMTRRLLSIIRFYRFPVEIMTKSPLISRDLDILKDIDSDAIIPPEFREAGGRGVIASFSFSTVDAALAKIFEPGAPSPAERLAAMKKISDSGLLTGACIMPVLPYLSDSEEALAETLKAIKEHGGSFALIGALTLYGEGAGSCREAYLSTLGQHYPQLLEKYEELYEGRTSPDAAYCRVLYERAGRLCAEYGLSTHIFPDAKPL
jgi:DNA repair photolyase